MHSLNDKAISKQLVLLASRLEAIGNRYIFERLGLTSATMRIMDQLARHEMLTPTEILRLVGSSKSNITQRLNFLEKSGYIARIGGENSDKRKTQIKLTPAGLAKYRQVAVILKKRTMHIEKFFTKEELDNFRNFSKKLNKLMDEYIIYYLHDKKINK